MNIRTASNELIQLKAERLNIQRRMKPIRKRIQELENWIQEFMITHDQFVGRLDNTMFQVKQTTVAATKQKAEKEADIKRILKENGVLGVDKVFEEIQKAQKGDPQVKRKLVIKREKTAN